MDGDGIETARATRPVAPGVRLSSYDRLESDKWLRVDTLSVDLDGSGVRADYLSSGKVADRHTVSELAAGHDPGKGRRTVAAINADFFDINRTGAPLGPGIKDGRVVHSPAPGVNRAVGIGPQNAGRVLELYFEGTLTLPSGAHPLAAYNAANVPAQGVGAYTPAWGGADRAATVDDARPVAEVTVRDGKVVSVSDGPGSGPVPDDTVVLVGREAGAGLLAALEPGDPVGIAYRARTDGGAVRVPPSAAANCSSSTGRRRTTTARATTPRRPAPRSDSPRTAGPCRSSPSTAARPTAVASPSPSWAR